MFFKREKVKQLSYSDRMGELRSAGYTVADRSGRTLVSKGNLAALLREGPGGAALIQDCGILAGGEMALLTDLGFQKIFLSPSGKKTPALAEHLVALHAFTEDLREALGLTSLYNEGLGTTNEKHLYDRVELRDEGTGRKPWERA